MQIFKEISTITLKENTLTVTAEVSSLYTIIPHMIGYQAARYFLTKDTSLGVLQRAFFFRLMQFAMEHTYFFYGGEYYLQRTGVAMGVKCAPSLASLFMDLGENDFLFLPEEFLPSFLASLYRRRLIFMERR